MMQLKAEMRRAGESLRETLERVLRRGLQRAGQPKHQRFKIKPRPLGLKPGYSYDNIGELMARMDRDGI